jgi:hypothetical protein
MATIPQPETTISKIDEVVECNADDGFRYHLGASIIGAPCQRQLWYSFRWSKLHKRVGRILRLFQRGHLEEPNLVKLLRDAGVHVVTVDKGTGKQFTFGAIGGHFGGSMDGAGIGFVEARKTWHVIEFKTSGDKAFKKLCKEGVEKAKPEHFAQMQMYMHWSQMDRAFYLVVNKNDDSLYSERVKYDKSVAEVLLNRAHTIITSDSPPEKISEDPSWYQCKWCDYQDICHGSEMAAINCRTCVHSTAELDGNARWSCAYFGSDIVDQKTTKCKEHLYNPNFITFAKVVDGDKSRNSITYEKADGTRFENCWMIPGYSSKEIQNANPAVLGDKDVDTIREVGDGRIVK